MINILYLVRTWFNSEKDFEEWLNSDQESFLVNVNTKIPVKNQLSEKKVKCQKL